MKIVIDINTRELIGFTENSTIEDTDKEIIDIGNSYIQFRVRGVSPNGVIIPGTIFSQEQINTWKSRTIDQESRRQRIVNELQTLVGLNIVGMTDLQRWKLVAVLLYSHGIINALGIVLPLDQWDILE